MWKSFPHFPAPEKENKRCAPQGAAGRPSCCCKLNPYLIQQHLRFSTRLRISIRIILIIIIILIIFFRILISICIFISFRFSIRIL